MLSEFTKILKKTCWFVIMQLIFKAWSHLDLFFIYINLSHRFLKLSNNNGYLLTSKIVYPCP